MIRIGNNGKNLHELRAQRSYLPSAPLEHEYLHNAAGSSDLNIGNYHNVGSVSATRISRWLH